MKAHGCEGGFTLKAATAADVTQSDDITSISPQPTMIAIT